MPAWKLLVFPRRETEESCPPGQDETQDSADRISGRYNCQGSPQLSQLAVRMEEAVLPRFLQRRPPCPPSLCFQAEAVLTSLLEAAPRLHTSQVKTLVSQ